VLSSPILLLILRALALLLAGSGHGGGGGSGGVVMEDKLSPTITSFSLGGETFNVPPRIPVEEIPEVTSPDRDGEGVEASNPLAKGVDLMDDALDLESRV